jgi:acetaldehyde dehydrogenase/alcohol dehydrogenase
VDFPPPLNALSQDDKEAVVSRLQPVRFAAGERIFRAGDAADGCYIIISGQVRLEVERDQHVDTEAVLGFVQPGSILGELALLDGLPRSISAFAETAVEAAHLPVAAIEALCADRPNVGLGIYRALGRDASIKLRRTTERLLDYAGGDAPDPEADSMVDRALTAQRAIERWPEERIDRLLLDVASAMAANAERLAIETVRETRIGNAADKTQKNIHASLGVCRYLVGKPGWGLLGVDEAARVTRVASPAGVVFAIVPVTNPVATIAFKVLIAIKARCALIMTFPRGATRVCDDAGSIVAGALAAGGAPPDLVQWAGTRTSRARTFAFMRHQGVSLILATGGSAMVRAAYSSGKPALGAGPGNAPVYVAADADVESAAEAVIASKTYDNGLICGAEHNLVVHASVHSRLAAELEQRGAAVLSAREAATLSGRLQLDGGRLDPQMIGQAASDIATRLEIERPYRITVIVVPAAPEHLARGSPLLREKLMPVLSLTTARDDDEAMAVCRAILTLEGLGHTAIIHTTSNALAERFGLEMPASRILVNSPGAQGISGVTTGLIPSFTLGCGTLGGNSTTDNVSYTHLLNIKRLAYDLTRPMPK